MKVIYLSLILLLSCSAGWSAAPQHKAARFARALQKAATPVAGFYINEYQNPTEEMLYQQAFALLDAFAPQGRKSVFKLTRADMPDTQIDVYVAPSFKLRDHLAKAGYRPDEVLPYGMQARTLRQQDKTGRGQKVLVFIASDFILPDRQLALPFSAADQYAYVAELATLLAREIYGYAYLYAYDRRPVIARQERETVAYGQSTAFLKRVLAGPQALRLPAFAQALEKVLTREQRFYGVWKGK